MDVTHFLRIIFKEKCLFICWDRPKIGHGKTKQNDQKKEKISSDGVEPRTIFNRGHYVLNWATTPYQVLNVPLKLTSLTFFAHEFCP